MQKKLTISVDEKVYDALHATIGRGNISRFIERLARPYLFEKDLATSYAQMAADQNREQEADEWIESFVDDGLDEAR